MQRYILASIIVIYVLLAALFAINTPKWQAPDEPAHFNYIRTIAQAGALPILQSGDYDQAYLQKIKDAKFPPSLSIDSIRYESYQPPLYYLAAAPVYLMARTAGLDAQVVALRLLSVLLGAFLLIVAFRIVREIFPSDEFLALATVGAIATIPQHLAITASISNDTAANLLLSLILRLAVRRAKNEIADRRFVILGGVLFGAALLTKTTAYLPGAALLIGAEIARLKLHKQPFTVPGSAEETRTRQWSAQGTKFFLGFFSVTSVSSVAKRLFSVESFHALRFVLLSFAISAILFAPWLIRGALTYGITDPLGIARHDAIVVGQPTTAEMINQYGFAHILFDYFAVTFKSFWAQFGWMGVLVNDRIYVLLFALAGMAGFGFLLRAVKTVRHRESLTEIQHWCIGLLFVLMMIAGADYIAYNFKFFQLQGRYLYPAIIPIMLFLVIGLREIIAREYERVVFAILYVGMVALDLASLFLYILPQLRN